MNKISCDVIRDLLPLYKDDVCSEKSKDLIEGHLPECEDCREYLDALNSELPPVTLAQDGTGAKNGNESGSSASDGIETLRRISRQINWLKVVVVLSAAIMVFVVSTSLSLVKEYNPELYLFDRRVAVEDMQMTELYQLENGDFYITLESEHPCSPISYGDRIDSPDSEYSESYDNGESCLSLEKVSRLEQVFLGRLDSQTYSFVVPAEETVGQEEIFPDDSDFWDFPAAVHKNSFIYYQGKHNKRFTIWKEGQEIMPAPASVEKRVQEELEMKEQGTRDSSGHEDILFLY
ncbi:MAG: zf-HC2 domain-containing protein [Dorea sp.]|jgi:hypothetical protein|nr:zf-HC2 domain-containing protein [Dorea sp.]MCI9452549.1 zf-HC2 domain-containing protein [Dorea sp.]